GRRSGPAPGPPRDVDPPPSHRGGRRGARRPRVPRAGSSPSRCLRTFSAPNIGSGGSGTAASLGGGQKRVKVPGGSAGGPRDGTPAGRFSRSRDGASADGPGGATTHGS